MLLSVSKMKKHDAHAGIPHIVVNIQLHFKENLPLQSLPHGIFSLYIQSPEQMSHIVPTSKRETLQINALCNYRTCLSRRQGQTYPFY